MAKAEENRKKRGKVVVIESEREVIRRVIGKTEEKRGVKREINQIVTLFKKIGLNLSHIMFSGLIYMFALTNVLA